MNEKQNHTKKTKNSGAGTPQRRDNAIVPGPRGTAIGIGAGDEAAAHHPAERSSTRTEHLRRLREAHRVSPSRRSRIAESLHFFFVSIISDDFGLNNVEHHQRRLSHVFVFFFHD